MREEHYTAVDLIRAARRDRNTKRPYLLVDPLQGKHVPVSPAKALQLFGTLGNKVQAHIRATDRVLIIAFAETATAIGAGIADTVECAETYLIQTTREDVIGAEYLYFSESHSHATEQRLVRDHLSEILEKVDVVIFAEDEVTTGNTIRHLMEELQKVTASQISFKIASLLNGMTQTIRDTFSKEGIDLIYLVSSDNEAYAESLAKYAFDGEKRQFIAEAEWKARNVSYSYYAGAVDPRRAVQMSSYKKALDRLKKEILSEHAEKIGKAKRILILGTEECMYPGLCLGEAIECMDAEHTVRFHATTRSPILPSREKEYPLHMRQELISVYDEERVTYLYDLETYDQVFILTDARTRGSIGIGMLCEALRRAGNTEITILEWRMGMCSSYDPGDVDILLKDITGLVTPQSTEEREKLIQSGRHYCEMLPIEYVPTPKYMEIYEEALEKYGAVTARAIGSLADRIMKEKGKDVVLISLARAGIPIGILLKRYIRQKYGVEVAHYSISIIRGRGIDQNAMRYILAQHQPEDLQFVDGWIGKGAILKELKKEIEGCGVAGISTELAVVADPAGLTRLCGTHEDILIPSSCLNSTVSGLISRTFLREDIIGPDEFHGAVFYEELREEDLSAEFIEQIESQFDIENTEEEEQRTAEIEGTGMDEVLKIMEKYEIADANFVKPGIGEATRVLLRRVPWKILIREGEMENPMLAHLIRLAAEKNVEIETYPLRHYLACGIIKKMADI